MAALGDEDIGGLDVAMDDAFVVGCFETFDYLDCQFENRACFHRAAANAVLQGLTVQEFHDDESAAALFADVVNRADIGMIECGAGLGFALETLEGLRVVG